MVETSDITKVVADVLAQWDKLERMRDDVERQQAELKPTIDALREIASRRVPVTPEQAEQLELSKYKPSGIRDAAITILRDAHRPMHTSELAAELKSQGFNPGADGERMRLAVVSAVRRNAHVTALGNGQYLYTNGAGVVPLAPKPKNKVTTVSLVLAAIEKQPGMTSAQLADVVQGQVTSNPKDPRKLVHGVTSYLLDRERIQKRDGGRLYLADDAG